MFEHVLFLSVYLFSIGIYGLITSRNMVTTKGKILIPLDKGSGMKPLDPYSDKVGFMAVTKDLKYINRSFFDENIPTESDSTVLALARTSNGQLAVMNLLNRKIVINNSELSNQRIVAPYKKGVTKPVTLDETGSLIFLEKNMDITSDTEFVDTESIDKFYGSTEISKLLVVKQEG